MKVGVLALQGDVPEHRRALEELLPDGSVVEVRSPAELAPVDGLLLPGGESTTISRLLRETGLFEPLRHRLAAGLPALATCAGLILLAREVEPISETTPPETLGLLDVRVRRNDYGSQVDSFEAPLQVPVIPGAEFPGVFIRAPRILRLGAGVEPIAFRAEEVVGVRQGGLWGFAFHPELSEDRRLHRAWLDSWRERPLQASQKRRNASANRTIPSASASQ